MTSKLGLNYASAGFIAAASTLSMAISNPWRGRLLDRTSLRRVLVPSIVIGAACSAIAPFAGYGQLAALVCISGLFTLPSFSIIRQAVIGAWRYG
ncbi:MAG: MFS transporter [Myxococcaceae bacterium]